MSNPVNFLVSANLGTCASCGVPCTSNCGACNKVSYCSKSHQQQHWKKTHKTQCFPLVLEKSEMFGRYLVTTRDIKQGEIILKETPIFSGPHFASELPLKAEHDLPICLSCFRLVQSDFKCTSCNWPLCSSFCEKDEQHSSLECKIFSKEKIPSTPYFHFNDELYDVYEAITVLRGALQKQMNPNNWSKIQDLQSHTEERGVTELGRKMRESSIYFVREVCQQKQITEEEIDHVLGAIAINAFVSDDGVSKAKLYRNGTYLCHVASMPAHNCVPNSSWLIQLNSDFHLRASVPIKCGESVTFLYTEASLGTSDRQLRLQESKYFTCTCPRCCDPTELGSYFSAVKCPANNCQNGHLLPTNPLKCTLSEWNCDTCGLTKHWDFIYSLVKTLSKDLVCIGPEDSFQNVEKLLKILEKHSAQTLHPNHYKLHDIENDILQRLSFLLFQQKGKSNKQRNYVNRQWADKLVELSRKCLAIADMIWPGYNRHRGRILYFLQQGLTIQLIDACKTSQMAETPSNTKTNEITELLQIRKQVSEIFKIEPEGREESCIAKAMAQEPPEIKTLKKYFSEIGLGN